MHSTAKHGGHNKTTKLGYVILAAIVISAVVYSVSFTIGPSSYGDDVTYLTIAMQVLSGGFQQSSYIFSIRLLMIYPIALFYKLMGISMLSGALWDIISYVGSIIVAFYIGKELYNEKAGLLSAFLMLIFPLTAILGVTISDDIPMMLLTSMLMLAILYAEHRSSRWWYLAAGALLVAPVLTTPEGAIIVPVALLYLLIEVIRRKIKINGVSLHFVYGAALAFLLLFTFNQLNCGNPFITFSVNSQFFSKIGAINATTGSYTTIPGASQNLEFYPQWMFPYDLTGIASSELQSGAPSISAFLNAGSNLGNSVGFFFYAAVIAALYLLFRRERKSYFAIFWFVAAFLYLEFGPMSFGISPPHYLLLHRLQRFLTLIAVPTTVIIAIGIAKFLQSNKRNRLHRHVSYCIAIAALAFLLVTSLQVINMQQQASFLARYDTYTISQYLSSLPNTTRIYLPVAYSQMFSNIIIYMKFDNMNRFYAVDGIRNCTDIPSGSYVVLTKYAPLPGLNYTPDVLSKCPYWRTALYPNAPGNYSPNIEGFAYYNHAVLYFVPLHNSTASAAVKVPG